jgi:hypothetical protein
MALVYVLWYIHIGFILQLYSCKIDNKLGVNGYLLQIIQ